MKVERIVLWTAAAVAAALVLELLFFLSLTGPMPRAWLLGALPDRVEARYVGFVLGEGDSYFRNPPRKCEMIELLEAAHRRRHPAFLRSGPPHPLCRQPRRP